MNRKELLLKRSNNKANSQAYIEPKISFKAENLKYKLAKRRYNISKIKFNQNIVINLLKKKKFKKRDGAGQTKLLIFPFKSCNNNNNNDILNTDFKICYNLNNNFHDLPGLSKFRNLTVENMNNLIKSDDISNKLLISYNLTKNKINFKSKSFEPKKKEILYNIKYKDDINNNINIYKNKSDFLNYCIGLKKIKSNDNFISVKRNNHNCFLNSYNSSFIKNEKNLIEKKTSNKINIKLSKNNRIKNDNSQIWKESIRDSIKKCQKNSKLDIFFFNNIENPKEFYRRNIFDKKNDKYQFFKRQISEHKDKLKNTLREIKLNQNKTKYMMKKFIFNFLTRKKNSKNMM